MAARGERGTSAQDMAPRGPGCRPTGHRRVALLCMLALAALLALAPAGAAPASKVFPMSDEGAAHLIEGLPNVETLAYPVGADVKEAPGGLRAVCEVPAYIDLVSTVTNYSRPVPAPEVSAVQRNGRPYRRYVFPPPRKDSERWARLFTQWVPRPSAEDRKDPGSFVWHFETPEGPESEQSLPIRLIPELPAASPPKRAMVRFWTSPNTNATPEVLPQVLALLQRVGVNTLGWWEAKIGDLRAAGAKEKGIRIAVDQSGMANWPDLAPAGPEQYTVDHNGRPVKEQDPQYVIDRNGEPWRKTLATCTYYANQVEVMSQDLEWGPVWETGFSPAGIAAFARRFGLDAAKLTPQIVWRDHRRQWGDFRAEQMLTLASYFRKAAKETDPKRPLVWLPGSPYTTTDPDLMSDMIEMGKDSLGRMTYLTFPFPTVRMQESFDVLQPMWYMHGAGQVREAFEWSRAIAPRVKVALVPLFLGQGRETYYPGGDPGEVLRAMAWATLLGGARGYGFWQNEFSPLQLSWLARANRELAGVEDVLLDGKPDPAGVTLEAMPKKRFLLKSGGRTTAFPVPDAARVVLQRAFAADSRRIVGLINLDLGTDAYFRVRVTGLPAGRYRVLDVSERKTLCPRAGMDVFAAAELARGFIARVPAGYGVTLLDVAPAGPLAPEGFARANASDLDAAYARYREPDSEGSVLAERAGLSIRYDMAAGGSERAVLVESAKQQVWIRPESGARISEWRIREGNRSVVDFSSRYGGAAMDLFWSPADAHWSGEEYGAYDLVDAKIHGGKAYVRLRQAKRTPSLNGLVVTRTVVVPAQGTDIQVQVRIENPGPAPQAGFSYWAHQMFRVGTPDAAAPPELFLAAADGVSAPQRADLVWAKAGQGFLPGNEEWERRARNGTTVGDWIAQRDPATGEAVLCQVESPGPAQFYSSRMDDKVGVSLEWMYPYVTLEAGKSWETRYALRYLHSAKPEDLPRRLFGPAP